MRLQLEARGSFHSVPLSHATSAIAIARREWLGIERMRRAVSGARGIELQPDLSSPGAFRCQAASMDSGPALPQWGDFNAASARSA